MENSSLINSDRILQPIWDMRLGYEEYLRSPLFPVFLSISFYLSLCIPFMLIDIFCSEMSWYKKYKIQPSRKVTGAEIMDTLSLTFWNHVLFILPAAMAQWIWTPPTVMPDLAPTLFEFVWHQAASVLIFDFQYYVWHYTHHKFRFLYKQVHALHHRYSSPFTWVTQYLHPWELVTVGFLTTTNTWFFNSHCLTTWSYMVFSVFISVEGHTGFDFPFTVNNFFPFDLFGGAPKHDMHHQKPLTNYQPFFNHFDRLFGSYCPPMRAGGVKTKALLEYERRNRETKKQG
ncbi:cholesterol 25-hydroxylase-like protein 1, member 2 [Haliotis cracherodii]|uniref:cholesterol 25-hydroxylase-like protein 1, member 2 n=1 Tax=Haliotis cracherodii TaxID=6455 RepID=UPI0039EC91FA